MDKYKKITDLGIEIHFGLHPLKVIIDANDLLKVLDAGVEVYGNGKQMDVVKEPTNCDTHSGLLINIKELKPKQVTITREDLDKAWKRSSKEAFVNLDEIAKELGL